MLGYGSAAITLDVYSGLFDDDLECLAERMDEAHVYSTRTTSEGGSVDSQSNVGMFRSARTETASWGSRDLNPGPTDHEPATLRTTEEDIVSIDPTKPRSGRVRGLLRAEQDAR